MNRNHLWRDDTPSSFLGKSVSDFDVSAFESARLCQDRIYMLKAAPSGMKEVIQKAVAPCSNQVRKGRSKEAT